MGVWIGTICIYSILWVKNGQNIYGSSIDALTHRGLASPRPGTARAGPPRRRPGRWGRSTPPGAWKAVIPGTGKKGENQHETHEKGEFQWD